MMRIELVRAWPGRYQQATVDVPEGASVGDALQAAGWALDGEFVALAVFGQSAQPGTALHAGDRVELLRALELDPKQARRLRAQRAKGGG